jgi:hypothetical protein
VSPRPSYIAGALLLGALLVPSFLIKDQRPVNVPAELTLRACVVDGRTLRIEVRNCSREAIFIPDLFHIPPDVYPLNPSIEIKDGERSLLRWPGERVIEGELPLFGMMITYDKLNPGESHTEDFDLPPFRTTGAAGASPDLWCTVAIDYRRDSDFSHRSSPSTIPHIEGHSSTFFPDAKHIMRHFRLRGFRQTSSP